MWSYNTSKNDKMDYYDTLDDIIACCEQVARFQIPDVPDWNIYKDGEYQFTVPGYELLKAILHDNPNLEGWMDLLLSEEEELEEFEEELLISEYKKEKLIPEYEMDELIEEEGFDGMDEREFPIDENLPFY